MVSIQIKIPPETLFNPRYDLSYMLKELGFPSVVDIWKNFWIFHNVTITPEQVETLRNESHCLFHYRII
jgi:hypothetical protein